MKPETLHWRIKARVLKKNDLKAFKNTTRNQMSCLLKIILIDKNRDEIQAIFYGEDAEHWNENLQEGKVYGFRGGLLKKTKPAFNAYVFIPFLL